MMDVASLMRQAAMANAQRPAVQQDDRVLTFGEAWTRGCRFANRLLALGLIPGDRVAVIEDNCLESSDIFLGMTIANIVRVPLYARNSADGHEIMVANTSCRAIVTSADYAPEMRDLQGRLPDLEFLIVRDAGYEQWLAQGDPTDPGIVIAPDDFYIIRHTGGTTGKPRGVSYTHKSWLATCRDWFYHHPPICPGDACLHVAPISHASGYFFIPVWLAGGRNVMIERFDAGETIAVMERDRIAYMLVVPTILAALNTVAGIAERDLSALKCLVVTSAPIADSTALRAREVFGDVLYQGYGQTEAVAVAYMGPRDWFATVPGSNPLRSCGRISPFARLEIWGGDRRPLPFGEIGEIVAQIDGQMSGYWNDPERTAEHIIDGWVLTGDIGMIDANGYLYLLDRADDMIVSGGYNIWPLELENALYSHPAILEVAVFGVPHPRWGETPMAAVVLKQGQHASEQELIQLCIDHLGSYKKPGQVIFRKEPLPKTPVGKVRRKDLREPYWTGHERRIGGS